MDRKLTYEELEQKIKELEKQAFRGRQAEEALRREKQDRYALLASEAQKADQLLRENEERYRTLVESSSDAILMMTKERRIVSCNQAFLDLFGFDRGEAEGKSIRIIHPSQESFRSFGETAYPRIEKEDFFRTEWEFMRKEGTIFPVDTVTSVIKSPTGSINGFVAIIRDITERKKAERELLEREKTLKAILAASPVGIYLTSNHIVDWANKTMHFMLGYEEDSLSGESTRVIYPNDEEYERTGRELYSEINAKGIGQLETRLVKKDGTVIDCVLRASSVDPGDISKGFIVAIMDITDRKQAEEQIHTLTQQLIRTQENERQIISREMHDSIGQYLSSLKIGCETLFHNQPEISAETRQKVSQLSKILQDTIIAVREMAYELRPPSLDQLGLVQTVFQYCEDFSEKTDLSIDFSSAGMDGVSLDFDTEINLYRLIQECLNNIRKHADANHVVIKLVASFPNIILRIQDDGKGFDVKERKITARNEKRMGLQSMEERVGLLQGKMRIQSRLSEGTKIFVEIPVQGKK